MQPVGFIESPFQEKLLIPRQPGLAPAVESCLRFESDYAMPVAARGLEEYSHVWLLWLSHATAERGWSPTVRPPRLGGNQRVGVFASRSTHRPNPVALSVVELIAVEPGMLRLRGADLLDGTPVIDVKPYLPYADAIPNAKGGYAPEAPETLEVVFTEAAETWLEQRSNAELLRQQVTQLLQQDPRPGYRRNKPADDGRIYAARFSGVDLRWCVLNGVVQVLEPA